MEPLQIPASTCTPRVDFNPFTHQLMIQGESYPENTTQFFSPLFRWIEDYLQHLNGEQAQVNLDIKYFNSSSSKMIMNLLDTFDKATSQGKAIQLNWIYHVENDVAKEYGEEFAEDLKHARLNLVEQTD